MEKEIRASVSMAVYNGEAYIKEQIDSIIGMLDNNDELVISYDKSTDKTLEIILDYQKKDSRIKVVYDKGNSVESNFNNAVENSNGKYIFLADQDDVWIDNKITKMCDCFDKNPKIKVLICNGWVTDEKLNIITDLYTSYNTSSSAIKNFIKGSYLGCEMAFTKDLKNKIWPVKVTPPLPHDLWLGVLGAFYGKVVLLDEKLIMHRMHDSNYSNTSKMKIHRVFANRLLFFTELVKAIFRNGK